MGFTDSGRASLLARNAITEREASLWGNALIATVSEEGASSTKNVITKGTSTSARAMTSEDHWGLRGGRHLS